MRQHNGNSSRSRGWVVGWVALATLVPLSACDTTVTNPGPVQDEFLNLPAAYEGIVNGANRAFNEALGEISRRGGSAAREIFPSGNTGYRGITEQERQGLLTAADQDGTWEDAHTARWAAEDGLRRFTEVLPADQLGSSEIVGRAYLLAGYSNRLLGDNFCDAVIDGGPLSAGAAVYYQRAAQHFTKAMEIFTAAGNADLAMAGRAGRASAHLGLNEWALAVEDAGGVPDGFVHVTPYSDVEQNQYNQHYWSTARQPFRIFTLWNTVYENYYLDTGDPRIAWTTDPAFPLGEQAIPGFGRVPFLLQTKWPLASSPMTLSSGREMRLIEVEALLVDGDWQAAMAKLNMLRTSVISDATGEPLEPWQATSLAEAWTAFKREHGIELWLEGRRLGAIRRWTADNRPGEYHPLELPGEQTYLSEQRALCFPVPLTEYDTNPNL